MLLFCGLSLSIVFKIITNEIQELAWNFIAEDIFQYSIFAIIHKPTLCITRVLEDEPQAFPSNFCWRMTKHINDDSTLGKSMLRLICRYENISRILYPWKFSCSCSVSENSKKAFNEIRTIKTFYFNIYNP